MNATNDHSSHCSLVKWGAYGEDCPRCKDMQQARRGEVAPDWWKKLQAALDTIGDAPEY